MVSELRKSEGMTVFLTTHYMEEAADADYVVILDSGKIVAEGTPLALKNTYTGDFITLYGITEEEAKSFGLPMEALRDAYRIAAPILAHETVFRQLLFDSFRVALGLVDLVHRNDDGNTRRL